MARLSGLLRHILEAACFSLFASVILCGFAQAAEPPLLRNPSLSRDRIAFLYADDVWTVSREGGEARRLTSVNSVVEGPYFSPDGTQIVYSTRGQGLTDVYVVNAEGGVPRRLTWEPTGNYATGWTADGKDVLFASMHASYSDFPRLFRTHADGTGTPVVLPRAKRSYRHLLCGWKYAGIRARYAMGSGVETLPRRPDHPGVAGGYEDPRPGESSPPEL